MANFKSFGVSPKITISSEETSNHHYQPDTKVENLVIPPVVGDGNSHSPAMEKYVSPWARWAFKHIAEPKYDGIADKLGVVSNKPDFIKDEHFISLMRTVTKIVAPMYKSNVSVSANMPSPKPPKAPPAGQR